MRPTEAGCGTRSGANGRPLPDLVDRDVERAARETKERERCRSITRIPPRPPRPLAWRGRVRAMTLDVGIAM